MSFAASRVLQLAEVVEKANGGDGESCYAVGKMHEFGLSPTRVTQEAVYWFQSAADQGDEAACWEMVRLCEEGVVSRNEDSEKWYAVVEGIVKRDMTRILEKEKQREERNKLKEQSRLAIPRRSKRLRDKSSNPGESSEDTKQRRRSYR